VQHSFSFRLLENPSLLSGLVRVQLLRLEPECNLLLSVLDAVGAVADVAANRQAVIATDGARGRGKGVGGTEDGWKEFLSVKDKSCEEMVMHTAASLDSVKTLPDHGDDGAAVHVYGASQ